MLNSFDVPKYRVDQLISAIYNGKDYGDNINLPKSFLDRLQELNYIMQPIKIRKIYESKGKDKTIKFLYDLPDGNIIEGVLMKYAFGNTLCVSTQVGCKMNCAFCASGLNGFVRHLSVGEILGQIIAVNRYLGGSLKDREITNIVLMGSGEPLDNYDNTLKFLKNATAAEGLHISARNISLSTCGIVPKMYALAEENLPINLTVSLHATDDTTRARTMPVAKAYKIEEILKACDYYFQKTGRRYYFEYTLIEGENCDEAHAEALIKLLKGKPCHVNLIRLNEVKERDLKALGDKAAYRFLGKLEKGGLSATLRRQIGVDIGGACGQLRANYLENNT